jgi:hypothetical protein
MNGNKPLVPFESAFTTRVAGHRRVAYYRYPKTLCPTFVLMVIDEILVAEETPENAKNLLAKLGAVNTGATVFEGDGVTRDVEIWRLKDIRGEEDHPDVAGVVWKVRSHLSAHQGGMVAPNHVLIPASNFHSCPWGPPTEPDEDSSPDAEALEKMEGQPANVTVIDSGYEDVAPIKSRVSSVYGQWFVFRPRGTSRWVQEQNPSRPGLNPLDQNRDKKLDALVGHANFVAGVIARRCRNASIHVVSHNGAFVDSDDSYTAIPTEASVARSLWKAIGDAAVDVINVGFAFPTLPNRALVPNDTDPGGPPSWTLDVVLRSIAGKSRPVVVAPAGNQDCTTPQYPAAFSTANPNVVGVGSRARNGRRSRFSNHGPWVSCSVVGEHVVSTFVNWTGETEEADETGTETRRSKTFRGWASWSGTSFAAPRVAAEIASRIAANGTPLDAWKAWKSEYDNAVQGGRLTE